MSTPEGLAIRAATTLDAPAMAELSIQLGYPVSPVEMAGRIAASEGDEHHLVLVAELDDAVVGWLHAAEISLLDTGRHCEILALVVGAGHRARGIGRALVHRGEAWASERRLDRLTVRSNVVRLESHPFYASVGFERIKTQHVYRKRL